MPDSLEWLRLPLFFGLICLFTLLELALPRRQPISQRKKRWPVNFGLGLINVVLLRLMLPIGLVGYAGWFDQRAGLVVFLNLPLWGEVIIGLIALDFIIYLQHRIFHRIDWLWAFHKAHHADLDLDTSSALRFHPGEAICSLGVKILAITLLGLTPLTVLLFEAILSSFALFNHTNWRLGKTDPVLQKVFVTPDMHRLHHKKQASHEAVNFGFCLSVWDHLLATYANVSDRESKNLELGLPANIPHGGRLLALLKLPFAPRGDHSR